VGELSFEIVEGPDAGRVVPVLGSVVIGSGPEVDVALADSHVEARHTRVTASGDGALVEDLGEPGGTFVNDSELRVPTRIRPGDELQVGVTVLKLRSGEVPSEVRPKPPASPIAPAIAREPVRGASEIDELLDVRTKRMARHAPLAVFVIVVYAVLIYLATAKL
jgi:pSer/pThr/pTyr-binding forkhead associated (FHA) protein